MEGLPGKFGENRGECLEKFIEVLGLRRIVGLPQVRAVLSSVPRKLQDSARGFLDTSSVTQELLATK
jgi:hypothetical protein